MEKEKIILRTLYNPYAKAWEYMAVFPEEGSNPGKLAAVVFRVWHGIGGIVHSSFDSFFEVPLDFYYRRTKIIHREDPRIPELLGELEAYYRESFCVVEKLPKKKSSALFV